MSSVSSVVQSSQTEKGVFHYSSEGRSVQATTGPRTYNLLHSTDCPYFLTEPLRYQIRQRNQMPNWTRDEMVNEGRLSMLALNALLGEAGIGYADLGVRDKRKVLKRNGLWAIPAIKRGPRAR